MVAYSLNLLKKSLNYIPKIGEFYKYVNDTSVKLLQIIEKQLE